MPDAPPVGADADRRRCGRKSLPTPDQKDASSIPTGHPATEKKAQGRDSRLRDCRPLTVVRRQDARTATRRDVHLATGRQAQSSAPNDRTVPTRRSRHDRGRTRPFQINEEIDEARRALGISCRSSSQPPPRRADIGVVVTGEATLQPQLLSHLESWLKRAAITVFSSALEPDAINTLIDCFVVEDLNCATQRDRSACEVRHDHLRARRRRPRRQRQARHLDRRLLDREGSRHDGRAPRRATLHRESRCTASPRI